MSFWGGGDGDLIWVRYSGTKERGKERGDIIHIHASVQRVSP